MAVDNVYTVRGVVYAFMNRRRMKNMADYEYLEQLAMEGVRYFKMNLDNSLSVKYLSVTNGIAKLPSDYINWQAVSTDVGGMLVTLALNKDLFSSEVNIVDDHLEFMTPENISLADGFTYEPHYYGGEMVPALYSQGSGFAHAYFNINMNNKTIVVTDHVDGSYIVLQYVGMASLCGETMIDPLWHEALIAWIDDKFTRYDDRKIGLVQQKEKQLKNEVEMAVAQGMPSIRDYVELLRIGTHRGIKR